MPLSTVVCRCRKLVNMLHNLRTQILFTDVHQPTSLVPKRMHVHAPKSLYTIRGLLDRILLPSSKVAQALEKYLAI